jgi:hypothetical protein
MVHELGVAFAAGVPVSSMSLAREAIYISNAANAREITTMPIHQ